MDWLPTILLFVVLLGMPAYYMIFPDSIWKGYEGTGRPEGKTIDYAVNNRIGMQTFSRRENGTTRHYRRNLRTGEVTERCANGHYVRCRR